MTNEDFSRSTSQTIDWLSRHAVTIMAVVGIGAWFGTWQTQVNAQILALQESSRANVAALRDLTNVPYRLEQAEVALRDTNGRVDNLSNTLIGQLDLMRRDVNRLTTTVEVLNSRVGLLTGEIDEPKQRRNRPPASE